MLNPHEARLTSRQLALALVCILTMIIRPAVLGEKVA